MYKLLLLQQSTFITNTFCFTWNEILRVTIQLRAYASRPFNNIEFSIYILRHSEFEIWFSPIVRIRTYVDKRIRCRHWEPIRPVSLSTSICLFSNFSHWRCLLFSSSASLAPEHHTRRSEEKNHHLCDFMANDSTAKIQLNFVTISP